MPFPPPRSTGSLELSDHLHEICLRVYHHDTDTQQIMHHAHYLIFAERARTEFLRDTSANTMTSYFLSYPLLWF